ncbi:hypothetical protein AMAG_19129 [Allomyces macrogynus ATCC 38327]|uniref:Uncharacterized protein n=1 Tax=Allomyces macrogynus (strain ATCC 38327) TaxID=578462 RepID=A0A0L0SP85_ALLM3|nr:hypothetical protein AMAG_19129 [Allomyces macrogynus ATCC 38327]|eukprot:KNE64204.1 hypothetical protein AMAG_19129 [Allomyces macrogynus ATCC 38327]
MAIRVFAFYRYRALPTYESDEHDAPLKGGDLVEVHAVVTAGGIVAHGRDWRECQVFAMQGAALMWLDRKCGGSEMGMQREEPAPSLDGVLVSGAGA